VNEKSVEIPLIRGWNCELWRIARKGKKVHGLTLINTDFVNEKSVEIPLIRGWN